MGWGNKELTVGILLVPIAIPLAITINDEQTTKAIVGLISNAVGQSGRK